MSENLELEIESRPGRVVLRFARGDETTEFPVSADGAEQLAENVRRAAERARDLE